MLSCYLLIKIHELIQRSYEPLSHPCLHCLELDGLLYATVIETCNVTAKHLFPRYVHFPTGDCLRDIVTNFETCWGFPQVAGAIDGTHIPIIRPTETAYDDYNRKGYYSIIMQAVVDFGGGLWMPTLVGQGRYMIPEC